MTIDQHIINSQSTQVVISRLFFMLKRKLLRGRGSEKRHGRHRFSKHSHYFTCLCDAEGEKIKIVTGMIDFESTQVISRPFVLKRRKRLRGKGGVGGRKGRKATLRE